MTYKTIVEVIRDGSLVMTDGILSNNGDMIFAYHALLAICNDQSARKNTFERDQQFQVQPMGHGMHSDRLKVTIRPEFAKDAIDVLKKEYPGLKIQNEQQLDQPKTHEYKQ
ncbi:MULTISPECIES: hypothetical protein [Legionella]|uniref:Uncharacterized protein n=1 Tax=Legionella steelei TaxID=947033 RepID=A0A0W0ZGC4_9GAMM|nr:MULTISPECIES: hypothetical protein [Legionella]KTD68193.1 hypothetical protein Lste_1351 [Legionella steelei]MBN9226296.1 hypothetical protein [Legionella steelei]OJW12041.1 MAG: hypothetical protein BGO44_03130 [Legionella sp. 39-23]